MDSYYYYNKTSATKQPPKPKGAKKISISILVISLPLLYASLLHVPLSSLFRDTTFWFLISNSIIFIVASDFAASTAENAPCTTSLHDEYVKHSRARAACTRFYSVKEEIIEPRLADHNADEEKQGSEEPKLKLPVDTIEAEKGLKDSDESERADSMAEWMPEPEPEPAVVCAQQARLCKRSRSELEETNAEASRSDLLLPRSATTVVEKGSCGMQESEYWKMSDEELNKRVEEFIRRFNREIRLQERQISVVY